METAGSNPAGGTNRDSSKTVPAFHFREEKEGIVGLTRTLGLELGRFGVTVNAIRPSAATRMTMTDQLRFAAQKAKEAGRPQMAERVAKLETTIGDERQR